MPKNFKSEIVCSYGEVEKKVFVCEEPSKYCGYMLAVYFLAKHTIWKWNYCRLIWYNVERYVGHDIIPGVKWFRVSFVVRRTYCKFTLTHSATSLSKFGKNKILTYILEFVERKNEQMWTDKDRGVGNKCTKHNIICSH